MRKQFTIFFVYILTILCLISCRNGDSSLGSNLGKLDEPSISSPSLYADVTGFKVTIPVGQNSVMFNIFASSMMVLEHTH